MLVSGTPPLRTSVLRSKGRMSTKGRVRKLRKLTSTGRAGTGQDLDRGDGHAPCESLSGSGRTDVVTPGGWRGPGPVLPVLTGDGVDLVSRGVRAPRERRPYPAGLRERGGVHPASGCGQPLRSRPLDEPIWPGPASPRPSCPQRQARDFLPLRDARSRIPREARKPRACRPPLRCGPYGMRRRPPRPGDGHRGRERRGLEITEKAGAHHGDHRHLHPRMRTASSRARSRPCRSTPRSASSPRRRTARRPRTCAPTRAAASSSGQPGPRGPRTARAPITRSSSTTRPSRPRSTPAWSKPLRPAPSPWSGAAEPHARHPAAQVGCPFHTGTVRRAGTGTPV